MIKVNTQSPVMVTGATGYVAGWLVKALLEAGMTVHAPVRDPGNPDKVRHLLNLVEGTPGALKLFEADLLVDGSYAEAMAGCEVVFHTASPFTTNVKDPQAELVDPALLGTRNVLTEATNTPTVKRVVVTSSCAAIYGDNADVHAAPGGVLTEAIWNTSSSVQHQAYSYSKTVAEQEAWKIADQQSAFRLVTVNPSLVLGPALQSRPTSESFSLMTQIGDGTLKSGVPNIGMGVVDVRDLAVAHMAAGFGETVEGRHIISGHNTDFLSIAQALHDQFGNDYPLPKAALPKWMLWLIGPMVNPMFTRKMISRNVNVSWKADNSKSIEKLGMHYRPLEETVVDTFQFMIDQGYFK